MSFYLIVIVLYFQDFCETSLEEKPSLIRSRTGSTVTMQCNITLPSFDPFKNPVVWVKIQGQERVKMNLMKLILEPFLKKNKFEVTFRGNFTLNGGLSFFYWSHGNAPVEKNVYQVLLIIKDLEVEDGGLYECEVHGKRSTKTRQAIFKVQVQGGVSFIYLAPGSVYYEDISDPETDFFNKSTTGSNLSTNEILTTAGSFFHVTCISYGGHPIPELLMFLGDRDIIGQFSLVQKWIEGGTYGFRRRSIVQILHTRTLVAGADDHGLTLMCTAKQPSTDFSEASASSRLLVSYSPIVVCGHPVETTSVSRFPVIDNQIAKVCISCVIKSWPIPTSVYWQFVNDVTTTTHASNETLPFQSGLSPNSIEIFDPLVKDCGDHLEASVCWRLQNSFNLSKSYFLRVSEKIDRQPAFLKLVAVNDIGSSEAYVEQPVFSPERNTTTAPVIQIFSSRSSASRYFCKSWIQIIITYYFKIILFNTPDVMWKNI